jgi:hypothetical protein
MREDLMPDLLGNASDQRGRQVRGAWWESSTAPFGPINILVSFSVMLERVTEWAESAMSLSIGRAMQAVDRVLAAERSAHPVEVRAPIAAPPL